MAAFKPMKHQSASLAHEAARDRVLDLSDAGTGKTAVVIWAFERKRKRKCGALLVLCPRTLMDTVWAAEVRKLCPNLTVVVASASKREAAFATKADVYVANHDAAGWLAKQKKAFFAKFEYLAIDEITAYKHRTSQRSRAMARVAGHFKYRRGMTATPNSLGITDLWHQAYLIDDGLALGREFFSFRNTIQEPTQKQAGMKKVVEWTDREGAEEAVYGILGDLVIRHKKEDCTDIPPTFYTHVNYQLTPKQRRLYDEMFYKRLLDHGDGINGKIVAKHGGAVATKVLQICSGAVYDNDKLAHIISLDRYELIMDLAAERVRPVIFYQWRHQLDELLRLAKARGFKYGVVNGETTGTERESIFMRYQAKQLDGLLAHPDTAAHGVTLTAGEAIIWPNPIADIELFRQANQRQARIGQKKKTEIVMVHAENTVEDAVYEVLMSRNATMQKLLDLFVEAKT